MNGGGKFKDKIEVVPLHLMFHLNGHAAQSSGLLSPNTELSSNKQNNTILAANKARHLEK